MPIHVPNYEKYSPFGGAIITAIVIQRYSTMTSVCLCVSESYRVTINFTDLYYTDGLGSRESAEFAAMKRRLTSPIEGVFADLPGTQTVNILQFRCVVHGTLIVNIHKVWHLQCWAKV